jgi:hypothetical protein
MARKLNKQDDANWWTQWGIMRAYKRPPVAVPTFADWCKQMEFPEGDFTWEQDEAGDPHVYHCGESDCPIGWHLAYYTTSFARKDGKLSIEVHSGDSDGNWEISDAYDEGDDNAAAWPERGALWPYFYETWLSDRATDDYFKSWADYHLDCAKERADPLSQILDAKLGRQPAVHISAAATHLRYLTKELDKK